MEEFKHILEQSKSGKWTKKEYKRLFQDAVNNLHAQLAKLAEVKWPNWLK